MLAAAEEIPAALADHWEDVTTAMHDADARHLYVDVAEPLAERAIRPSARRIEDDGTTERFRAQAPTSAARKHQRGRVAAPEGARLRLPRRRHLRDPGRGGARPLQPQPRRGAVPRRGRAVRARRPLHRGAAERRLRLARAAAGGDPLPAARPPPPRGSADAGSRPDGDLRRPAGRRLRRPRGPRDRPLRRLRDQDPGRGHPRLPRARVPRRGQGLRAHRPARQDHPLRRRRRRRAAALGARLEALGCGQGARAPRRAGPGRRAAQPLRRAPGAPRTPLRARRRVAARARAQVPLPRDRRPDRRDRGGEGATWSPSGRWTG